MKRFFVTLMALACVFSLAACGSKTPSQEDVEKAIAEGSLTVEDALDKGFVTQEWADAYYEAHSVPASDKLSANAVGEFTTQTLSGEEFTRDQIADTTFFAFIDPTNENAAAYYQSLVDAYEGVKEAGAEILVCAKGEETGMFADAPFPVIPYDDAVKEAVQNNSGMIEELPCAGSWYVNGAFLSSWYGSIEADKLPDNAAAFVQMQKDMSEGGNAESSEGSMSAMPMG